MCFRGEDPSRTRNCNLYIYIGVAIVSLDAESMYKNMSEELATRAVEEYLKSETFLQDDNS